MTEQSQRTESAVTENTVSEHSSPRAQRAFISLFFGKRSDRHSLTLALLSSLLRERASNTSHSREYMASDKGKEDREGPLMDIIPVSFYFSFLSSAAESDISKY